jgi:DNA-binding LytR/AlgR family response regulator
MIKVIVIEDDEVALVNLKRLLKKIDQLDLLATFDNPIKAISFLEENDVDLMFLDLHMPGFSGFDLLENKANLPSTIITTSDSSKALDAFQFNVIDYLIKPIDLSRLMKSIEKFKSSSSSTSPLKSKAESEASDHVYINIQGRLIKIQYDDLYIVEAKGDYVVFKTKEKDFIVHSTLKRIEEKLSNAIFMKIHRSYIININKIVDIEDNSVLVKKDIIPISRSNKKSLMDKLNLI